jgi:hypothetical protein
MRKDEGLEHELSVCVCDVMTKIEFFSPVRRDIMSAEASNWNKTREPESSFNTPKKKSSIFRAKKTYLICPIFHDTDSNFLEIKENQITQKFPSTSN